MVETVGKSRKFTSDGISRTGGAEIVKKNTTTLTATRSSSIWPGTTSISRRLKLVLIHLPMFSAQIGSDVSLNISVNEMWNKRI